MRDLSQERSTLYAMVGKRADSLKALGPPDEWQLVESIGEGTYGEVYKARNILNQEIAAAKVIDSIHEKIEEVLPELEILKKFSNHPNIAGFFGAYIKKDIKRHDQLWFTMELCRGGSVTNLVKSLRKKGSYLEEDCIAYILHESLKGIEHLHRHHVIHRDIKGPNVMLTTDAQIRLIDFGVSAELTNIEMRKNSSVGTPFWMAPEVIACEQQLDYSYDVRCDIWSLGITAIELADGSAPLSDQHPMRALFKIPRSKPPTMKNPERWSHEYRNFIAKCLVKDFEGRPHAQELLRHSFISWVPGKITSLRRKLKNIMDSQYQGKDGITDERQDRYFSESGQGSRGNFSASRKSSWRNREMLKVDDLATLSSLTEDVILSHLLERYLNSQIYTYIGDILIAVNPQQHLNIYSRDYSRMYRNTQKSSLPPHIFMVADMTYQAMINNKNPQCCLISGESGAGKTVSANFLVQQLAELGKAGNRTLEEKILQVNPLMEALGNAQTVINGNSSRFGKYLELHFTSSGALTGGKLTEYLLEKSRVVSQAHGERNFHIFYYMLAGMAYQKKLEKYSFKLYSQHHYLQTGGRNLQDVVCTMGNRKKFEEFQRCFDILGFTHEEVSWLFSILAAIIHIGDIQFQEDESVSHLSDKSMVTNPQLLLIVSSLLGINAVELRDALTTNSNVTRGETIVRNNTVDEAIDCRDGMAKALYGKLFSWIVTRINALLKTEQGLKDDNDYKIGILDIFGFENFKRNSFEQLCINIANEQIQFYFNQQIFSWELEEYRSEGIPFEEITFEDNRPVLDMFLQKPMGLLSLLDEESRFPKATDFTLVEKFNSNLKSPFYERPKEAVGSPMFVLVHYAGRVKYDATNFLEKNRDTLSPDIIHVLRTSENRLVRTVMQYPLTRVGVSSRKASSQRSLVHVGQEGGRKMPEIFSLPESKYNDSSSASKLQQTVSVHFRLSLRDLLSKLLPSESHFVRCIRPNDLMIPGRFDQEKVLTQLRYAGVLETTRIRRQGYSERITFPEFVKRYQVIYYPLHKRVPGDSIACREILKSTTMDKWLIGRNKVFLKYYHVERLAKMLEDYRRKVITAQRFARGWLMRRRYKRLKLHRNRAALVIQKYTRGHLDRRLYKVKRALHEGERRRQSAITIQVAVRSFLARKRFLRMRAQLNQSATRIQAGYRGHSVRRDFHITELRQEVAKQERRDQVAAAVKIQSAYRGSVSRKEYQNRKGYSEHEDVAAIYFLQQIAKSSVSFYETQREQGKVPNSQAVKGPKRFTSRLSEEHIAPFITRDKPEFLDDVGHQQEIQRIYFMQQVERSWHDTNESLRKHLAKKPLLERGYVYTSMESQGRDQHTGGPGKLSVESKQPFEVRPMESVLSEVRVQDTARSQRTYRREIWPAGDESYFKTFVNESRKPQEGKDQERRRMEMLSIVEGLPSEEQDGEVSNGQTESVSKTKERFEYPICRPQNVDQVVPLRESLKRVEPKQVSPSYDLPHKPQEVRRQHLPVKQVQPVKQIQPVKKAEPAKQVQPVKHVPYVPHVPHVPYKVVSPVKRDPDTAVSKPSIKPIPQKVVLPANHEPQPKPRPVPSSSSTVGFHIQKSTAPSKLGYLRHVPSDSIHNESDRQQVEQLELRRKPVVIQDAPDSPSPYSHVLRRTGRRACLGIEGEEQGGGQVTRITFDRPLAVS